mmetsp:Transcript_28193/g.34355  ORF Transcript_28193/g.34355 Transcript_28193/m.34355 type:complete len:308 (+) Transcript_28193:178-1101(+)
MAIFYRMARIVISSSLAQLFVAVLVSSEIQKCDNVNCCISCCEQMKTELFGVFSLNKCSIGCITEDCKTDPSCNAGLHFRTEGDVPIKFRNRDENYCLIHEPGSEEGNIDLFSPSPTTVTSTNQPTSSPSSAPTVATSAPSPSPSPSPSFLPTSIPTVDNGDDDDNDSDNETSISTDEPTYSPTWAPSSAPTVETTTEEYTPAKPSTSSGTETNAIFYTAFAIGGTVAIMALLGLIVLRKRRRILARKAQSNVNTYIFNPADDEGSPDMHVEMNIAPGSSSQKKPNRYDGLVRPAHIMAENAVDAWI